MNNKHKYYLPYHLQFFANDEGGEKTEEPTTKKLTDARKEGQVAKSQELTIAVSLMMIFLSLKIFIGYLGNSFMECFAKYFGYISNVVKNAMGANYSTVILGDVIKDILFIALPIMLIVLVVNFVTAVVQVKWKVTGKPLMPKFSKISPLSGFKRLFNKDKAVDLIKAIVKIAFITYIVFSELSGNISFLQELYTVSLMEALERIGNVVLNMGLKISALYLIVGFADLFYQKRKFKKDMRMSKQEVKDEYKNTEGNPEIKGRIRQKMREQSQRRMMQELPNADVVITNPTHLAVALKYDQDSSMAPVVIAKGADHLASKIKEAAKENHIEIVENKPVARMLYFNVEIGQEIPQELYQAVAEILAYVYKLKNK